MITPEFCQMQAQYNAWQNNWIKDVVAKMDEAELRTDRGAFFGSIAATLNHILWADQFWFFRLGLGDKPVVAPKNHTQMTATIADWTAERTQMDDRIIAWANGATESDLTGTIEWRSALKDSAMVNSRAQCIMHMFNHQTHHRGQVHAMLTGSGQTTQDTDLVFMELE